MYYLSHYVIDWDKVVSLDDIKRLLKVIDFSFEVTTDIENIKDLVKLVAKKERVL